VKAITMIADEDGTVDTDFVKVEKKVGGTIEDSEIIEGVVIDKEPKGLRPSQSFGIQGGG
uniref:hypothetical protein n=1 Tax=Methanolacinia paynteri TaxID=230356 RepID=UPI00064E684F